jgi:hypothetical protein
MNKFRILLLLLFLLTPCVLASGDDDELIVTSSTTLEVKTIYFSSLRSIFTLNSNRLNGNIIIPIIVSPSVYSGNDQFALLTLGISPIKYKMLIAQRISAGADKPIFVKNFNEMAYKLTVVPHSIGYLNGDYVSYLGDEVNVLTVVYDGEP